MNRIEIDVQTGLQTTVDLTAQEIADAQASKAAWDAEQAAIVSKPSLEEMVAILQAEVASLKAAA
tara:strand:- start:399 stop:593 length:195 start_codon:yes stop_codon:yes gene_type:complete